MQTGVTASRLLCEEAQRRELVAEDECFPLERLVDDALARLRQCRS
jgi:hypothetical protein